VGAPGFTGLPTGYRHARLQREEPREFTVPFGLNQPGAEVELKVYAILTTGNEAGGAAMLVQRPANVLPLAA